MKKILVIQPSFIGDVILATSILENIHQDFPDYKIDLFIRKGNEGLFEDHPYVNQVYVWNKKNRKLLNLFKLIVQIRKNKYYWIINCHRFATSGLVSLLARAENKAGYDKNPFSFCYSHVCTHQYNRHETERNHQLIDPFIASKVLKPRLYPSASHQRIIEKYTPMPYICLAPGSVWATKQLPKEKWAELIQKTSLSYQIFLVGGANEKNLCEEIIHMAKRDRCVNLAGELKYLETVALMTKASMNYVNDSAPLHMATAGNSAVTAFFCSTVPEFGFGPLSDVSIIAEIKTELPCRPCGIHGKKQCPQGHFKCGFDIDLNPYILSSH